MLQSKQETQNKIRVITALVFLCLLALHLPFIFFKSKSLPGSASPTLVLNLLPSPSAIDETTVTERPYVPSESSSHKISEELTTVTENAVQELIPTQPAVEQKEFNEISAMPSEQEYSTLSSTESMDNKDSVSSTRGIENIRYRILLEIEKNKMYPRAARKRGLEGDVTLAFTVEPNGSATDIRIIRSTATSLLDTAALKAVENSFPMDIELSSPLEMQVTLRFALTS